jgi:hypothetical protein
VQIAEDPVLDTPHRLRYYDIMFLSRAAIMQSEIDRFMAVARGQRH